MSASSLSSPQRDGDRPSSWDYGFAGGGVAALCLLRRLARDQPAARFLVVDPGDATAHHTYAYWSQRSDLLDDVVERSFERLEVVRSEGALNLPLGAYRYRMFHLGQLRERTLAELAGHQALLVDGRVSGIEDDEQGARFILEDGRSYACGFAFDSRPPPLEPVPGASVSLLQSFHGVEVVLDEPRFDDERATLMDFRTPQEDGFTFGYVLPSSSQRAFVETVRVSRAGHAPPDVESYLREVLGTRSYHVVTEEGGATLLTDAPFGRRTGPRTLTLGLLGGRLKPSTGYAVARILDDVQRVAKSLARFGHPFDLPVEPASYRALDRLMLEVMRDEPREIPRVLFSLFANNPTDRVLRFLDEEASKLERLAIVSSLPKGPFARALAHRPARSDEDPGPPW